MLGTSKHGSNGGSCEDMEAPIYGSTLPPDVRAQFNATMAYLYHREDVLRADLDKGIEGFNVQLQEVQNMLKTQLKEGLNNLNLSIRSLEEWLPPPGGGGVWGQQGPNHGRCAMSYDGDHYYGADFDENMSDDRGGVPRHLRHDLFDHQCAGHGGYRGGGVECEMMVSVELKSPYRSLRMGLVRGLFGVGVWGPAFASKPSVYSKLAKNLGPILVF